MNDNPVQIYDFPDEIGPPPPPPPPPRMRRLRLSRQWRIWLAVVAVLTVIGVGGAATRVHTIPGAATVNKFEVSQHRQQAAEQQKKRAGDQNEVKAKAVGETCAAINATATPGGGDIDSFQKLNDYTNSEGSPDKVGPAVDALNHLAEVIVASFGNGVGAAQPDNAHQVFEYFATQSRAMAAAISSRATWEDFDNQVAKLNDAQHKTVPVCNAAAQILHQR